MGNKIDIDKLNIPRDIESMAWSLWGIKLSSNCLKDEIDSLHKNHFTKINNISNAILDLVNIVNEKGVVKQKDFVDVFTRRNLELSFKEKNMNKIKEIIKKLEEKNGEGLSLDDISKEAEKLGISRTQTEDILEELKRIGDIFEPKPGDYRRL